MATPPLYPGEFLYPSDSLYPSDGIPDPDPGIGAWVPLQVRPRKDAVRVKTT